MAIWLVRAGRHGEQEEVALENGMALVGWEELPDLAQIKSREDLTELLRETYPNEGPNKLSNWCGQLWAFRERIQKDDLVRSL